MRYIGIAGAFALSLAIFTIAATRPHAFGDRSAKGITADIRQRFPAAAPLLARRPRPTGLPVAEALHVTLPRTYEGAQIVTGDGLSVEVVPLHVQAARRGDDDGLVVYADAWRDTDVICNPGIDGSEEFLYLRSAAAPTDFVHRISSAIPGRKLTAVRLAEGCIELSDANGGSLRIGKPFVIGHDGSVSERHIAWKVEPQEAGTWLVRLELNPEGLDYPLLIDPSWTTTRGMGMQRARHAAPCSLMARYWSPGGIRRSISPPVKSTIR